jgi:hypothetical protein
MSLLSDLQSAALKVFTRATPAYAYVFKHHNQTGIRVEAPDIVKEFSDGVPLGRDPKGNLYFYNLRPDFNQDKVTQYLVSYPKTGQGVKTEIAIVIDFYRPNNKAKPYAKFIALLPPRAHASAIPYDGTAGGKWNPLNVVQATALAESESTSATVDITATALRKKFSFEIPPNVANAGPTGFESWGYLIVKDTRDLKTDTTYYVDYTNTRILVFVKQGDQNAVAVFGSYEIQSDYQPFDASFQVLGGRFVNL